MTNKDCESFSKSKTCHVCELPFSKSEENLNKVRDHCHVTEKYRGAAHST